MSWLSSSFGSNSSWSDSGSGLATLVESELSLWEQIEAILNDPEKMTLGLVVGVFLSASPKALMQFVKKVGDKQMEIQQQRLEEQWRKEREIW
jgi:hypothetical protein